MLWVQFDVVHRCPVDATHHVDDMFYPVDDVLYLVDVCCGIYNVDVIYIVGTFIYIVGIFRILWEHDVDNVCSCIYCG